MLVNRKTITIFFALTLAVSSIAQSQATAYKVTGITVDGYLDEGVWTEAEKIDMCHDVNMMLKDGSIDSRNDASTQFVLLWDEEGFYCGSWNRDDIHNAPWTPQPGMVNQSWKDDGHEYWISCDFNDVWEDASPPYFGQFGWQIWKGWVWSNGAVDDRYVAYRNDNGPINTTVDSLREIGHFAPYSSFDGVNFNQEAFWEWSGLFLGSMPTPSAGKELGFNLGLTDNDGGDMAAAWLRWADGSGHIINWGKIALSDETVSIRPAQSLPAMPTNAFSSTAYDVLGRRIRIDFRRPANGLLFQAGRDERKTRSVVLR